MTVDDIRVTSFYSCESSQAEAKPASKHHGPQQFSSTGVIILPTQTMHYNREIPEIYHRIP